MVNYKDKYLKYKLKYLNIKNKHIHKSNIKGGAQREAEEGEAKELEDRNIENIQINEEPELPRMEADIPRNAGILPGIDRQMPVRMLELEQRVLEVPEGDDDPPEINVEMGEEDIEGDEDDEEIQVDMRRAPYIIYAVLQRVVAALQDLMNNRRNVDILPDNVQVGDDPEEEAIDEEADEEEDDEEEANEEEANEEEANEEEAHNILERAEHWNDADEEEAIDEEADEEEDDEEPELERVNAGLPDNMPPLELPEQAQPEVNLGHLQFRLVDRFLEEVREGDDPEEEARREEENRAGIKEGADRELANEQRANVQRDDHELQPGDDG